MNDKKKKMLSAIRLWAIYQGMDEIIDEESGTYRTDIAFKKEDNIYGFIIEFDRDVQTLKSTSVSARDFCDYVYIVTDDAEKKKHIEENTVDDMGIVCYSNLFGLGMVYQVLKEATLIK